MYLILLQVQLKMERIGKNVRESHKKVYKIIANSQLQRNLTTIYSVIRMVL